MNRILMITDDIFQLNYIKKCLLKLENELCVHTANSVKVAYKIDKDNNIKIFIIDNYFSDENGIEMGQKLRIIKKYKFSPIIFINGNKKYEMQAFHEVHCYDFILDSCCKENVISIIISFVIEYLAKDKCEFLCLKYNSIQTRIKFEDIYYIESKSRRIHIKTKYEEIKYKIISMRQFKKELNDNFIQVHQSIIVNKLMIEKIFLADKNIKLIGVDELIPIGETYKKRVNRDFEIMLKI